MVVGIFRHSQGKRGISVLKLVGTVELSGYIGNAIRILLLNFKFATWQHPAVGHGSSFAVTGIPVCVI